MKKLLLILLCLPIIGFGQCITKPFTKSTLSNLSLQITSTGDFVKLLPNGTLSDGGSWWISNKKLYVDATWQSTYIYPLSTKLVYGRLPGYWIKDGASENTKKPLGKPVDISSGFKDLFARTAWNECVNRYIDDKINDWLKQGEFEKTVAFQKRVNESTRKEMEEKYRTEAIEHFKKEAINSVNYKDITLKKYNPDIETFLIKISGYESFNLPVPISKAPSFKKKFNASNFSNLDLILEEDKFIVSHFEIDGYSYDISGNGIYNKCIGDCHNGYGNYTSEEGTYKGNWKDGKVHGRGIFKGNEYTYDGEYINGKQHGQGKKTYTNGTIEEGMFKEGDFIGE